MAKYQVTLFRQVTDLVSATVEVECDSTKHDDIVAAAITQALSQDNVDWDFDSCLEADRIDPALTSTSDVHPA